jgi:hypothetical protein
MKDKRGGLPSGALVSVGHIAAVPVQVSAGSQVPVLVLQTVPAEEY